MYVSLYNITNICPHHVYDFASHAWSCRTAFSVSVYIISPISLGYGLIQLPVFSLFYVYFSSLPLIV